MGVVRAAAVTDHPYSFTLNSWRESKSSKPIHEESPSHSYSSMERVPMPWPWIRAESREKEKGKKKTFLIKQLAKATRTRISLRCAKCFLERAREKFQTIWDTVNTFRISRISKNQNVKMGTLNFPLWISKVVPLIEAAVSGTCGV